METTNLGQSLGKVASPTNGFENPFQRFNEIDYPYDVCFSQPHIASFNRSGTSLVKTTLSIVSSTITSYVAYACLFVDFLLLCRCVKFDAR